MSLKLPDFQYFGYEIKEWWERLGIRKWINQNPRIIIGITTASVLILLVIVIWQAIPKKTVKVEKVEKEWFYDLNTGKLFVAKTGQTPPIKAPSGPLPDGRPAGVRAYVFSYSYEPNEAERFIGFLETVDPNAEKGVSEPVTSKADSSKQWRQGRLIRRVEDTKWVPADSKRGQLILKEVFHPNEKGERAQYCRPD
jgi:hypothetical protein